MLNINDVSYIVRRDKKVSYRIEVSEKDYPFVTVYNKISDGPLIKGRLGTVPEWMDNAIKMLDMADGALVPSIGQRALSGSRSFFKYSIYWINEDNEIW